MTGSIRKVECKLTVVLCQCDNVLSLHYTASRVLCGTRADEDWPAQTPDKDGLVVEHLSKRAPSVEARE